MQNIFLLIVNEIKYAVRVLFFYSRKWYNDAFNKKAIKNVVITDSIAEYTSKWNKRFADSFMCVETDFNRNIDFRFYSESLYNEMIQTENHSVELYWKTNILMECTPFGNVVMYYNVFRNGFVYYSDINLSYKIINAVAMKYVLAFSCRDLFMDEQCLPESHNELKILKIINDAEKQRDQDLKEAKKEEGDEDFREFYRKMKEGKNTPFLKPKTKNAKKNTQKENAKEYNTNRFIYSGKLSNFQLIQKPPKKMVTNDNGKLNAEEFDYKKWKTMNQFC